MIWRVPRWVVPTAFVLSPALVPAGSVGQCTVRSSLSLGFGRAGLYSLAIDQEARVQRSQGQGRQGDESSFSHVLKGGGTTSA